MKRKNRKQKQQEYYNKYKSIPVDYNERLNWMYDYYNITDKISNDIINKRYSMMNTLQYKDIIIELFEEPEGAHRPRFRLVNRQNLVNQALNNGTFVHVYSINAKEDNLFMQRMIGDDLINLENLIYTPCIVEYNTYTKTPSSFSKTDIFLSEIGLIRPITKPDWDNIGKKYSDMMNHNIWLDDYLVISGTVNKYYSILPRIEIKLRFLNMLYNKYQYNSMSKKVDFNVEYFGGGNYK